MNVVARWVFGVLSVLTAFSAFAADPGVVLRKPMIVGASVSAGFGTTDPGTRAALRYTSAGNILNTAVAGAEGVSMNWWSVDYVAKQSIVIGVDWMFWDAVLDDPSKSIAQLKQNLAIARAARVPVIIGDVPRLDLRVYRQKSRDRVNGAIHSLCKESRGCYILPFARIYDGMLAGNMISYRNEHFDWWHLSSDGLHLNATGAEYMADLIVGVIRRM